MWLGGFSGTYYHIGGDGVGYIHAHQRAKVVVDSTHQNQHEGWVWHCWQKNADGGQVADNANQNWVLDLSAVTDGENLHMEWESEAGGDAELQLWEGITYESGTAFTPLNMNRASTHTPPTGTVTKYGATITTSSATQLDGVWMAGGQRNQSVGGSSRGGLEWILSAGKKYAVILINRAGAAKDMSLSLTFYED